MASDIYYMASTNILEHINHIEGLLEEHHWDNETKKLHGMVVLWHSVMICNMYWSLPDLLPMILDQMCRPQKHPVRSKQKVR